MSALRASINKMRSEKVFFIFFDTYNYFQDAYQYVSTVSPFTLYSSPFTLYLLPFTLHSSPITHYPLNHLIHPYHNLNKRNSAHSNIRNNYIHRLTLFSFFLSETTTQVAYTEYYLHVYLYL